MNGELSVGRVLFYCDTYYQVFTAMNIIISRYSKSRCDIAIYHQFQKADSLIQQLSNSSLVENVFEFYPPKSKADDIIRLIKSREYIRKCGIRNTVYSDVFFACLDTNASLALYSSLKYDKCFLFDDGTGSYRGDIINDYMSWKRRILLKTAHPAKHFFNFDTYYLYAPEISKTQIKIPKEKISVIESDELLKIFRYIKNDKYSKRFVFLEQPYDQGKREKYDCELNNLLKRYVGNKLVVRLHPRMKLTNISVGEVDTINNAWELECIHQIENNNILVSIFSTAVFQPKLIANKDAKIILLFRIYKDIYTDLQRKEIEEYVKEFQNVYPCVTVFIPENIIELENILKHI